MARSVASFRRKMKKIMIEIMRLVTTAAIIAGMMMFEYSEKRIESEKMSEGWIISALVA
jgi:hypothetical protein